MKYSFCWQVEKVLAHHEGGAEKLTIGDEEGGTVVACGPWRETRDEADRDEVLYREDRPAFFRMLEASGSFVRGD